MMSADMARAYARDLLDASAAAYPVRADAAARRRKARRARSLAALFPPLTRAR